MTRNELVETLARYYGLRLPDKDSKGRYIIEGRYWEAGCSKNGRWLSLEDIVCALESNCW